uniref:Candidate secreted effector n=1 Tax=Meloidogyne incognita TaxID=6306 RepID=A0A914KP04_MELIC
MRILIFRIGLQIFLKILGRKYVGRSEACILIRDGIKATSNLVFLPRGLLRFFEKFCTVSYVTSNRFSNLNFVFLGFIKVLDYLVRFLRKKFLVRCARVLNGLISLLDLILSSQSV